MKRLMSLVAGALALLVATPAEAHVGYKIQMTGLYKETKKGGTTFRNVFVTGHAHYVDGVVLEVGVRPEKSAGYLIWTKAPVRKEEFAAELGPWRETFPAGTYVVEAWFDLDKQPEAVKSLLAEEEEFSKCLKDDPTYQEKYKRENPERYEKLMRLIAATGRCASTKQFGTCRVTIGTPDDAQRSNEEDRAFIRDHADLGRALMGELLKESARHSDPDRNAGVNAEAWATWSQDWVDQLTAADGDVQDRLRNTVYNEHKETYSSLGNSLMALGDLQRTISDLLYGAVMEKTAELAKLNKKLDSELSRDERRRRDILKREIAGYDIEKADSSRRAVESIAETLYGHRGLDPAPERMKVFIEELKAEFGLEWKD